MKWLALEAKRFIIDMTDTDNEYPAVGAWVGPAGQTERHHRGYVVLQARLRRPRAAIRRAALNRTIRGCLSIADPRRRHPRSEGKAHQVSGHGRGRGASQRVRNRVVVISFVNQTITFGNDAPMSTAKSVPITLDKMDRKWLISSFDPV